MKSKIMVSECEIIDTEELYYNKPFFRKMNPLDIEYNITLILQNNPHPNVVPIYNSSSIMLDIELLNIDIGTLIEENKRLFITDLLRAKKHLHNIGIVYIDWNINNIGYSVTDECFKIFDFDGGGIFNINTNDWIMSPNNFYSYKTAINNYLINPIDIDDYCFFNYSKFFK